MIECDGKKNGYKSIIKQIQQGYVVPIIHDDKISQSTVCREPFL